MKKLLLGLLFVATTATGQVWSLTTTKDLCDSGWEPTERSDKYIDEYFNKLNALNPYNLYEWLEFLDWDLRYQGVPQDSWVAPSRKSIVFRDLEGPIGIAEGMFRENTIEIQIDYDYWNQLSTEMRLFLIYHEAGHDYWEIWHNQVHMLKPYMSLIKNDISRNNFLDWRDEMFLHIADKNQARNNACPSEEEGEPEVEQNSPDDEPAGTVGDNDEIQGSENICHYHKQ